MQSNNGTGISAEHMEELRHAKSLLENVSLAVRLADLVGKPVEGGFAALPEAASNGIAEITRKTLESALRVAMTTLSADGKAASNVTHKMLVGMSGAAGGVFGLPALAIELPVSTTIMLRSIADIARSEGEDIRSVETRVQCLGVFALGGRESGDDAAETGYLAARYALTQLVKDATAHLTAQGMRGTAAPVLIRLINALATRFGVQVTQKFMAQAVPVVGAAGGALVNTLFIDHFQDMARGHFTVRRLERTYGAEMVQAAYATA